MVHVARGNERALGRFPHLPSQTRPPTEQTGSRYQALIAVVVKGAGSGRVRDAGDGAQIFVNGLDVLVGHASVRTTPRHDLNERTVQRKRNAVFVGSAGTSPA